MKEKKFNEPSEIYLVSMCLVFSDGHCTPWEVVSCFKRECDAKLCIARFKRLDFKLDAKDPCVCYVRRYSISTCNFYD